MKNKLLLMLMLSLSLSLMACSNNKQSNKSKDIDVINESVAENKVENSESNTESKNNDTDVDSNNDESTTDTNLKDLYDQSMQNCTVELYMNDENYMLIKYHNDDTYVKYLNMNLEMVWANKCVYMKTPDGWIFSEQCNEDADLIVNPLELRKLVEAEDELILGQEQVVQAEVVIKELPIEVKLLIGDDGLVKEIEYELEGQHLRAVVEQGEVEDFVPAQAKHVDLNVELEKLLGVQGQLLGTPEELGEQVGIVDEEDALEALEELNKLLEGTPVDQ